MLKIDICHKKTNELLFKIRNITIPHTKTETCDTSMTRNSCENWISRKTKETESWKVYA